MKIGYCAIDLKVLHSQSLKNKRSVIKRIIARITRRFNASVAEVADQNLWQRATLGVALVGNNAVLLEKQLRAIAASIEDGFEVEIIAIDSEVVAV